MSSEESADVRGEVSRPRVGLRVAAVLATAALILLGHYLTPTAFHAHHDVYRRLFYIPIILAGFWFGLWGGLITAVGVTIAYFPHIFRDWGGDIFGANLNRTLETGMYIVVGLITGSLSQSLRRERDRLARVADDRQRALRALEAAHSELREKTRDILEAEEQLRRADRLSALGHLSAGLAHEIRNPLGSIRGTAEILSDKFQEGDREYEFLQILLREVTHLNGVLSNFLEFARGEQETGEAPRGECSAGETAARVRDLLAREAAQRRIDLRLSSPEGDDRVAMPGEHLSQIVLNLLLNALQVTPEEGRIDLTIDRDRESLVLTVSDSGPGVPADRREDVFEPFFTTRDGGTGLGLAIVAKLLESHGASVSLGDSPLGGAQFTLTLPRAA
jgi:signal transduction histidine kinase